MLALLFWACSCMFAKSSEATSTSSDWEAHKQKYKRVYNDASGGEEYRRGLFEQNIRAYAALNAREPLAHFGPNKFSAMTPGEYLGKYIPSNASVPELEIPVDTSLNSTVPESRDWTGIYTTLVRSQDGCGACWANSAIEQVESDAAREHNWTWVLSSQELLDCTLKGQGSHRNGCEGGDVIEGYKVLQAVGGAASGYEYKFRGWEGRCKVDDYTKHVRVDSYWSVGKMDKGAMKQYVGSTGPLSVCVDSKTWHGYTGGIVTKCGKDIDHCVQLVGYGIDRSSNTEYWKIRNSWGAGWGEEGHIRLKMGENLCNVASNPTATSTSVLGPAPVPSPSPECQDLPDGWTDGEADPCSTYVLNSYCAAEGREGIGWNRCAWGSIAEWTDDNGVSALEACCGCGGGSAPVKTAPLTPSPPSTCRDYPENWTSEGESCCDYEWKRYCTEEGGEGPSWLVEWGQIEDYTGKDGLSALDACCVCGGGRKKGLWDPSNGADEKVY